jgi:hypothetical protein
MRQYNDTWDGAMPKEYWKKLNSKTYKCIFFSYCNTSKAYWLWNMKTHKVVISNNIINKS